MLHHLLHLHSLIDFAIGTKYVATARGNVWKSVSCERCRRPYAYLMQLEAIGDEHDLFHLDSKWVAARAQMEAEENLARKRQKCVLPVPCPNCGHYQQEMVRLLKEEAWINPFQIAGLVIAAMSLIPLAIDLGYAWTVTLPVAVVGLGILIYGYVVSFRFDPNAGSAKARKAIGQRHAVWDEQLAKLSKVHPST